MARFLSRSFYVKGGPKKDKEKSGWLRNLLKRWKGNVKSKKALDKEAWEQTKMKILGNTSGALSQSPANMAVFREIRDKLKERQKAKNK